MIKEVVYLSCIKCFFMFKDFPKERTPLPKKFQEIYAEQYKENRDGDSTASGLAQKMESWLHKKVANDITPGSNPKTLEIGAGTLNQLPHEPNSKQYDIIEPFTSLFENSPLLKRVDSVYKDIDEIDLSSEYDRITSIAVFEHITDLPKVVAKTCLLLNEKGSLRTSIPNEGTFLWTLGWKMTTGLEFKLKHKLDYGILMKHEHVNTAKEIEEVLNYFYGENKCSCFGLGKSVALYRFYESTKPNIERAKEYLKIS